MKQLPCFKRQWMPKTLKKAAPPPQSDPLEQPGRKVHANASTRRPPDRSEEMTDLKLYQHVQALAPTWNTSLWNRSIPFKNAAAPASGPCPPNKVHVPCPNLFGNSLRSCARSAGSGSKCTTSGPALLGQQTDWDGWYCPHSLLPRRSAALRGQRSSLSQLLESSSLGGFGGVTMVPPSVEAGRRQADFGA